jgi:hypothetical protein
MNLKDGSGSADRLNGDIFLETDGEGATVFDDGDDDDLRGKSGTDWYFANLESDHTHDGVDPEIVEQLADSI